MYVTFRAIRDKSDIDSSFTISYDDWRIGESVSIMFDATPEQVEAINSMSPAISVMTDTFDPTKGTVSIQCVVVERSHAITWKSTGRFESLCTSAKLEATSALWEDVLLWVLLGQKPEWATN